MKYPEIFLLPALMFADYFLTVAGSIKRDKKYSEHFKVEHYELNPIWQKSIAEKKWFNVRHILLTVSITAILAGMVEFCDLPNSIIQCILGALFVSFSIVVGRHLSNILMFRYLIRRPNEISGQVTTTHSLMLWWSMYQYLAALVPIAIIALFAPSPFAIGALIGAALIFVVHLNWIRKYKKKLKKSNKDMKQTA